MEPKSTPRVEHAPEQHRYEILDDGAAIGRTEYVPADGQEETERIFYHTEVDEAYSGQGLASVLVRQALDDTIAAGLTIVPVCPYIKTWLKGHPEYQEHASAVRREHLQAVRQLTRA
ncbi:N-acetyltransferase [Arthrobacter echini]|uniref:N-acetyltransferase n=1 Tax=Arthrobacter echini TaxID=1529066 RepID=A0A4S5E5F7_9MICC|nr:GNAT family N-acetyltransferase [Arthrobacter echini]THJ66741.1 N-acetyltransferase [Arthrobacter echini]